MGLIDDSAPCPFKVDESHIHVNGDTVFHYGMGTSSSLDTADRILADKDALAHLGDNSVAMSSSNDIGHHTTGNLPIVHSLTKEPTLVNS